MNAAEHYDSQGIVNVMILTEHESSEGPNMCSDFTTCGLTKSDVSTA